MDIDSSVFLIGHFSLLGNSKCHWDCVGTSLIQRYGNDLDGLWKHTPNVPVLCVTTRGNCGGGKEKQAPDSEGEAILVGSLLLKSAKSNHPNYMIATMESVCCG